MASVFHRKGTLWIKWRDVRRPALPVRNQWVNSSTGLAPGQEKLALQLAEQLEQGAAAAVEGHAPEPEPRHGPTVSARWEDWAPTQDRKSGWPASRSRMRTWVLPSLGSKRLADVTRKDLLALLREMQRSERAPNYIAATYQSIHLFFADAVRDEQIAVSPATLDLKRELGLKRQPKFNRATAIYTQAELEQLITDERLHPCDRVLWALEGCAGLRQDDAAHLTFAQWEQSRDPLGCLHVEKTKTGVPRQVPIHPTLAALLAEWKLSGWGAVYGRAPRSTDLICPKVPGERAAGPERERDTTYSHLRLVEALELLGLRRRRSHDLRRTFISLCRAHGSDQYGTALRLCTHGRESGVFGDYTEALWSEQCKAVLCLPVRRRERAVVRVATGAGPSVECSSVQEASVVHPVVHSEIPLQSRPTQLCADVLLQRRGQRRPEHASHGLVGQQRGVAADSSQIEERPRDGPGWPACTTCTTAAASARRALDLLDAGDVEGAKRVLREMTSY